MHISSFANQEKIGFLIQVEEGYKPVRAALDDAGLASPGTLNNLDR